MTTKKSFIMYLEYSDFFDQLSKSEKGELIELVFSYLKERPVELSETSPAVRMAFTAIRQDLDRNAEKYAEASVKRSDAAKKREEEKRRRKEGAFALPCESTVLVDNGNGNGSGNANVNGNSNVNSNENVSGNGNVNSNENVSDNGNANANEPVCAYAQSALSASLPAEEPYPFDDDDGTELTDKTALPDHSDRTALPDNTNNYYSDRKGLPAHSDNYYSDNAPSYEDVKRYCMENGFTVDPDKFVKHYSQKGWRTGSDPVRDWKALLRSWQSTQRQGNTYGGSGHNTGSGIKSRTASYDPYSQGASAYDLDVVQRIDYAQYMDL